MLDNGRDALLATLRLVETMAGVGHWHYDLRTEKVTWSDEVFRIHGFEPGSSQPSYDGVAAAYHEEDRPAFLAHVASAIATGRGYNFKLRLKRASTGEDRIVRAIAEVNIDDAGAVVELFGVFQDITEEEKARIKIEESESRYRMLADASVDIVLKTNIQSRIDYISPAVARYGYAPERLVGRLASSLVHPEDIDRVRRVFAAVVGDAPLDRHRDRRFRFLTAGGGYVWMEGNPAAVRGSDGAMQSIVSTLRDVSERQAAESALAASEARYRLLAENTQDIVVRAGRGGIISYASPSCRVLGITPEEAIGRSTLDFVSGDDRAIAEEALNQLFSGDEPDSRTTRTYRSVTHDGRTIWLEGRPSIIRDYRGQPVEFVTVFRDVTERQRLIETLEAANLTVHTALRERKEFLANISHDLKAPLAAMLGYARELRGSAQNDDARLCGARIADQGEELLCMIEDLLDRAALDEGRLVPRSEPFGVADMISSVTAALSLAAREKGLAILVDVAPNIPLHVKGDRSRIRRILMNIAHNAIKFTNGSSVSLSVHRGSSAGSIRFAVSDDGPGLSPGVAEELFQRFMLASPANANARGDGLGLAICRELVHELGGAIGHESGKQRHETVFWFEAPLAPIAADGRPDGRADQPLSILVVDDSHAFQRILSSVLESLGHSVVCVGAISQARTAIGERRFDLMYVDRNLPDGDGLAFVRGLRTAGNKQAIVLVTSDDSWRVDDGSATLLDAYLTKPLEPADVVASLAVVGSSRS